MNGEGTLRDMFALSAMNGFISHWDAKALIDAKPEDLLSEAERIAKAAYQIADAMEAESNRYQT